MRQKAQYEIYLLQRSVPPLSGQKTNENPGTPIGYDPSNGGGSGDAILKTIRRVRDGGALTASVGIKGADTL